ncbi:MAG: hypothetical protein JXR07_06770 [Reichenbachiella sp.]
MKNIKSSLIPHLVALIVFVGVTVLFFAPMYFQGKVLPQHDITQAQGSAQEIIEYKEQTGDYILWTNSMFSGMPAYLFGIKYEGELIAHVHKILSLYLPHPTSLIFLSFISFYIMLLVFGVRSWLAIAGALVFGFTDFSIIGLMAGHNSKIAAVAFMPLVLAGIHMAFERDQWKGMALTALGLALQIRTNHLQITYYLLLIVIFYGLYQLFQSLKNKTLPKLFQTVGILIIAAIIAVGCNFGKLWTIMEYSKYSTRGKTELTNNVKKESGLDKEYAFQYSNGIIEPLFLFIPNFMGGSMQEDLGKNSNLEKALLKNGLSRKQVKDQVSNAPTYWGNQPSTAPYYGGAIMIFLFVLGLFILKGPFKYWMTGVAALGIILSWGDNFAMFNNLFFDYFPGYNKFRSVTFTIIITVFSMTLIAFLGLEKLLKDDWNKDLQMKFLKATGAVGGFALLCILFANIGSYKGAIDERLSSYPAWYLEALRADRASLMRMDAIRSLFFVLAFASVIWFYVKSKLGKTLAYTLMIGLVFIDMFGVAKRFIDSDSFERKSKRNEFALTEADKVILKDKDPDFRVLNLRNPFNDALTSYHHKSIGGYHGAKMGRYQDLITNCITDEHSRIIVALQNGNIDFGGTEVINMLNTKYFLAGTTANTVLPNENANGNAWFVTDVNFVNGADEEIATLKESNTKNTVIIDQTLFKVDKSSFDKDSSSQISLSSYHPEKMIYHSNSKVDGLAVFSEVYYPKGWTATIDNVEVPILRGNYILRSLEVPAGTHEIIFSFNPTSYSVGKIITLISNITLLILIGLILGIEIKNRLAA